MTASQAAKYILNHPLSGSVDISPLKLQKLIYYVKVWSIIDNKPNVISSRFMKWPYGPVNNLVYQEYKKYGSNPIPKDNIYPEGLLSEDEKKTVDFILENYLPIDAISLSLMTHKEDPWIKTGTSGIIGKNVIKAYYSDLPFANNFPLDFKNQTFYPLSTNSSYAYFADVSQDEMNELLPYKSYEYYKKIKNSSKEDLDKKLKKQFNN